MNIGKRLEAIAALVPEGCVLADIGTDHAYLPVQLLRQERIKRAVAGDIAAGPCRAAAATIAAYNMQERAEVRRGSGLEVLRPGEADCIVIAGMGGATISKILSASMAAAAAAELLLLQPMTGAPGLRRWLVEHGWRLADEELVDDPPHFYEIICARRGRDGEYSPTEYAVGPVLLRRGHSLLPLQLQRLLSECGRLLEGMERSERARSCSRYKELQELKAALEVIKYAKTNNR